MRELTVLVIDDEPDVLRMLELILTRMGHDVVTATSGMDGIVAAHDAKPDVIFLDVMMEGMDGWEALKLLKMEDETRAIPVIMLSARVQPKDKIRGLQGGAIDYVTKPFAVQKIRDTLAAIVDGKKMVDP